MSRHAGPRSRLFATAGSRARACLSASMSAFICAELALLCSPAGAATASPAATAGASPADSVRFEGFADAVQYVLFGHADTAEIPDDAMARPLVEKAIGKPTRVRVIVRKLADLGGDGCKRIATQFIALDAPLKTKDGKPAGVWAGEMAINLCQGGQPPEPGRE